jgi:phosphopantothenoylcysteine decarboxylase/phosphopantothenate--cysteine ligase
MALRQDLQGKRILVGLSGGIACYKAAELARVLVKEGATVQVVMTEAAEHFITPVTLQALTNRSVYTSQWDAREPNNMAARTGASFRATIRSYSNAIPRPARPRRARLRAWI